MRIKPTNGRTDERTKHPKARGKDKWITDCASLASMKFPKHCIFEAADDQRASKLLNTCIISCIVSPFYSFNSSISFIRYAKWEEKEKRNKLWSIWILVKSIYYYIIAHTKEKIVFYWKLIWQLLFSLFLFFCAKHVLLEVDCRRCRRRSFVSSFLSFYLLTSLSIVYKVFMTRIDQHQQRNSGSASCACLTHSIHIFHFLLFYYRLFGAQVVYNSFGTMNNAQPEKGKTRMYEINKYTNEEEWKTNKNVNKTTERNRLVLEWMRRAQR